MGVITDREIYGVKPGVCFSFPVTCRNGRWTIVEGLSLTEFSKQKLTKTEKELNDEKRMALGS